MCWEGWCPHTTSPTTALLSLSFVFSLSHTGTVTPPDSPKVLTQVKMYALTLHFTQQQNKRDQMVITVWLQLSLNSHVQLGNKKDCESVSPVVEQMKQSLEPKTRQLLGDSFAGGGHRMFFSAMIFLLIVVAWEVSQVAVGPKVCQERSRLRG